MDIVQSANTSIWSPPHLDWSVTRTSLQIGDLDGDLKRQTTKLEEFEIACNALEEMNEKLKRACEELETEKKMINAQCNKLLIQVCAVQ